MSKYMLVILVLYTTMCYVHLYFNKTTYLRENNNNNNNCNKKKKKRNNNR